MKQVLYVGRTIATIFTISIFYIIGINMPFHISIFFFMAILALSITETTFILKGWNE